MTGASKRVLAVDAFTVLARIGQTVVDIVLAVETCEARRTLALITSY